MNVNYPNFPQLAIKKKLREPNNYTMLTINGVNFELSYHSIHFEELNNLIGMHRSEIEKQNESARELLRELKARAASKKSETRELANTYKRDISKQLSKVDCCVLAHCYKIMHIKTTYILFLKVGNPQGKISYLCAHLAIRKRAIPCFGRF